MKKSKLVIFGLVIILGLLIITNPTEQDYKVFSFEKYGEPPEMSHDLQIELERINFLLFSTYTPFIATENGITHLGIMGTFVQISDGQFDYPVWLELFN